MIIPNSNLMERLYENEGHLADQFKRGIVKGFGRKNRYRPPPLGIESIFLDLSKSQSHANCMKTLEMVAGQLWQSVIGSYGDFRDLGRGDLSGLDLIHPQRKFAMELKYSWNTDNHNSRCKTYEKLVRFHTMYPEYTVVYGFINTKRGYEADLGVDETIIYHNVKIRKLSGRLLLRFLFDDDVDRVVSVVRNITQQGFASLTPLP